MVDQVTRSQTSSQQLNQISKRHGNGQLARTYTSHPLTVLLNVEPRLVDDDPPVSGEDLHGDPQGSNEDE